MDKPIALEHRRLKLSLPSDYFLNLYENVQLAKRDIVTAVIYYYTTTEFHYAKDDSRLLAYGGVGSEVSYFCYICYKNIKISAKMSIRWAMFCAVLRNFCTPTWSDQVGDGGNHVTFSQAVRSDKYIFLKNYNSSQRAWTASVPVRCVRPNLSTFSASILLKSQWHQASKTLKNVVNFFKPALHMNKTCYISLTNIHSFVLQTKHFHWSSRYSCLGNCLVWKVNLREKTFTLHGWTQMEVFSGVLISSDFFSKLAALKPQITILWLPNYSAIAVILILRTSNVFFFTWLFPLVYGKTH